MNYCMHVDKNDITQGLGSIRNYFCPDCGWHKYNGKEYTKKEWEKFIEEDE